uniref:Si:ch1073-126c3.2 n=1 Tax=Hucho hucho TaxID=62062 RepID=A0A4W5LQD4_9TELE
MVVTTQTEGRNNIDNMTQTTTRRVLLCFCSLTAVLSYAVAQEEDVGNNSCSSTSLMFKQFSTLLMEAARCAENITSQWNDSQTAVVINSLQTLTVLLQKHKKAACQEFEPKQCPAAVAQSKGGLVCVTVNKRRYCKPRCNEGYDFAFLRNSRLYEECSADTRFKWTTQYIGGNKLAVCNKSSRPIAGAKTAYFPKNQDCLTTKSYNDLEAKVIDEFISELKDIEGTKEYGCLVCG